MVPVAREAFATLMLCVLLLGNLGASITEVAQDALVAEYGQKHRRDGLHSYGFMGLAAGGILGNLFEGYFLQNTQPNTMFLLFTILLLIQVAETIAQFKLLPFSVLFASLCPSSVKDL